MAYYNGDQGDSYYDPYNNSSDSKTSIISTLSSAAKSIAIVGVLNMVGGAAAKKASGFAGRAIKAGVFGQGKAFNLASGLENPTIGGILKQSGKVKAATNWFNQTSIGKAQAARTQFLEPLKGTTSYGAHRVASAFKSPATMAGVIGGVWAKNSLAGAPVAYAVDSALGITQNELGLQRKAWWDVPGKIGNAAKWFAYDSVYSTAFGGVGALSGAGRSVAAKGLQNVFKGKLGDKIYDTISQIQGNAIHGLAEQNMFLKEHGFFNQTYAGERSNQTKNFAASVVTKSLHMGKSIRDVNRQTNAVSSSFGQAIKEGIATKGGLGRKVGAAAGPINAALKTIVDIKNRKASKTQHQSSNISSGGIKAVEFLTRLSSTSSNAATQGAGNTLAEFNKFMGPEFAKLQKKGTADYVHKRLKRTTIRDIASEQWIKETEGSLSKKFAEHSEVKILMNQVLNMNVGSHVFHRADGKHIKGGAVDLSLFSPGKMMKRALSFLGEHQFSVPLTKHKFAVGDLTGLNDQLAERPDFHLFRNKANFSVGVEHGRILSPNGGTAVTISDMATASDALFINMGSKWGVFDGAKVSTIDTDRVLRFTRPNSKAKANEVRWIQKQRELQSAADAGRDAKIAKSHNGRPLINNRFFNYLNGKGISVPRLAENLLEKVNNMAGSHSRAYLDSAAKVFGPDAVDDYTYRNLPNIDNVLNHTSQVYSRILHRKDALLEIGKFSGAKWLDKDLSEIISVDRPIREQARSLGLHTDGDIDAYFRTKPELHEAVAKIEAFPRQAEKDIVHKKLGFGSDMNSYDVARVNMVDDFLNTNYWTTLNKQGQEHPLVAAAGSLRAKGLITEKEMKAMQLHGKLSAFKSQGMFSYTGSHEANSAIRTAVDDARRHAKEKNWEMLDSVRDYISNNKLHSPKIAALFEQNLAEHKAAFIRDRSPFASVPTGLGGALQYGNNVADTLGNVLEDISFFKRNPDKHYGLLGTARYIAKNAFVVGAAWQGYNVADAIVASTPMLDRTSFDDGITGFAADNIAKGRLVGARLADTFGITPIAKRLEGLMPMSMSTFPGMIAGAVAGKTFGGGLGSSLAGMAYGAVINRLADPYLPDATKSYEELKDIYSGKEKVAMMKSPTWLLGGTPWEGTKVEGFTPNWYVRAKSRWKETATAYGSPFRKAIHEPIPLIGLNIGDFIDPFYMERLHYFDRPYGMTGDIGSEIPIVGKLVGPLLTSIFKPKKIMHSEFLADDWTKAGGEEGPYNINNPPPTIQEHEQIMNSGGSSTRGSTGRAAFGGNYIYGNSSWADTASRQFLLEVSNAAGLQGFLARTAVDARFGSPTVIPTIETAGRMSSMSRSYYDANLGGMGALCLPKGEQVLTSLGLVNIEDINVGDLVLSDKYIDQAVTNKSSRLCKLNEKLYTVILDKAKTKISATEDHPFAIFKNTNKKKNTKWSWIEAKHINVGDFAVQPLPAADVASTVIYLDDNTYKYIDEELAWFIGTWIAKGIVDRDNIIFNVSKKYTAEKLGLIFINKAFGFSYNIIENKETNTYTVSFSHSKLAKYLCSFGNGDNRSLKSLINLPDSQAIKLCQGYMTVVGLLSYDLRNRKILSTSNKLIRDIWLLLFRLGVHTSFITNSKKSLYGLNFNKVGFNNLIKIFKTNVSNGNISSKLVFTDKDYLYIKITNIECQDYTNNEVYDITVNNSHCFIGNYALLHNSEPIRRLVQKPEYSRYGINPIPNMMPNWLPDKFLTGDAYSLIMRGELRLPGRAYESVTKDIKRDFSGRASMVGGDIEHVVQYFTGLLPPVLKEEYDILETGTSMHAQIQDSLAAEGMLISAESFVVDVKNNITGHVDAVISDGRGGGGRRALEIKTISKEGFEKLDAPKNQHVGQLNFYLRQLKMNEGTIMYVVRDNPTMTKTFDLRYSQTRWEKDLNKLQKARQIAADMMQQGVVDKYGYTYSWTDKLNILADVAPGSKEYKEAKHVVDLQIKNNLLSESEITKYKKALRNRETRLRKYELYPTRFKNKVMSPDTEANIQSINDNIKAAAEYNVVERVAGSLWERFTNTNFFAINKLWHVKDPLEHYKLNSLYGKEYQAWDEPYRGWIEPLGRGLASKTDTFTGGLGWATTGYVFGGGAVGALGGAIGAGYGTVHGLFRKATGTAYIPGLVQDQREIESYFDSAKYVRNQRFSQLSNGVTSQQYNTISQETLHAFNQGEGGNIASIFKGAGVNEKPYISAWLNESDQNRRDEILKYVPSNLANALRKQWGVNDNADLTSNINANNSAELSRGGPDYKFDGAVFDPSVNLEDIKLKTVESAGYDAHEFGLGWNEQQYRLLKYSNEVNSVNYNKYQEGDPNTSNLNQGQIRMAIIENLRSHGIFGTVNVFINNYNDSSNVVNIIIKRDRSRAIVNALTNRDKWM